jgi:transcriptional antiterminator NusG
MAAKWYAIQTYAGSERSVKNAIETMAEQLGIQDKIEEIAQTLAEHIEKSA